ncbi:N-acetylmuramidase domain-containing protein, partial [uncultured Duncaniella sp.]
KNWAAFARGYNGPAYARRRYHTRMASAYARHSKCEKQKTTVEPDSTSDSEG